MIYLDNGATSFPKPLQVRQAVVRAMQHCANPGRGGYPAAMAAASAVYDCRETAGELFHCSPEQVVLTNNCTHGLNMAIGTLTEPGDTVAISGFEHNAVVRPLHAIGAKMLISGRRLFDREDTLTQWEAALSKRPKAAVFTHVSNVFGYILPIEEMAKLCRKYHVPFIVDAAQSAGSLPLDFETLGADFVAMPGHKGLLGPHGTGLLLCRYLPKSLMQGGTGGNSLSRSMPDGLPEGAEAGTLNVPGIAGLTAGMRCLKQIGIENLAKREHTQMKACAYGLKMLGIPTFTGEDQSGTLSFIPKTDCEEAADLFAQKGIALRAGLHCAPLAHESAGTLETGTVRLSFGHNASRAQSQAFLAVAAELKRAGKI